MLIIASIIIIYLIIFPIISKSLYINFSKEKTNAIKGVMAILIVLHHCMFWLPNNFQYSFLLKDIGAWVCSVFFIISGYGLFTQLNKIKKMSFIEFLRTRVFKILLPFLIISIGYITLLIMAHNWDFNTMCYSLLKGNTDYLLPYSWFVFVLSFLYITTYFLLPKNTFYYIHFS